MDVEPEWRLWDALKSGSTYRFTRLCRTSQLPPLPTTATMSAFNRNTDAIHGHCACGALQYSIDIRNIENDLKLAAYCHCARCQRLNGAPYIWTNHWLYHAVTWKPLADGPPPGAPESSSSSAEGLFSPAMQTFEALKGRKWKLRCRQCGSPMGSWNAGRGRCVAYCKAGSINVLSLTYFLPQMDHMADNTSTQDLTDAKRTNWRASRRRSGCAGPCTGSDQTAASPVLRTVALRGAQRWTGKVGGIRRTKSKGHR